MSKVLVNETSLAGIADAIRAKNGTNDTYKPSQMPDAITNLPSGGGGDLPEEAFLITGDCQYRFYENGWNWFIEEYGDRITTRDIAKGNGVFYGCNTLTEIPFDLNFTNDADNIIYLFYQCKNLLSAPNIIFNPTATTKAGFQYMFSGCYMLRDVENVFSLSNLDAMSEYKWTSGYSGTSYAQIFPDCYSLRKVPTWLSKIKFSPSSTSYPNASNSLYNNLFKNCYALDEVINLPVQRCNTAIQSSNMFSYSFDYIHRAKNITFETQADGTPYIATWKNQVIDLTKQVGWVPAAYRNRMYNYNSGISRDKEIITTDTYQALKNDPDCYTVTANFSRYNHDSAVNTINSLPDTSATGTNTIKFSAHQGIDTDGGAINTLTEEEIAVATAKGWTVTLS